MGLFVKNGISLKKKPKYKALLAIIRWRNKTYCMVPPGGSNISLYWRKGHKLAGNNHGCSTTYGMHIKKNVPLRHQYTIKADFILQVNAQTSSTKHKTQIPWSNAKVQFLCAWFRGNEDGLHCYCTRQRISNFWRTLMAVLRVEDYHAYAPSLRYALKVMPCWVLKKKVFVTKSRRIIWQHSR